MTTPQTLPEDELLRFDDAQDLPAPAEALSAGLEPWRILVVDDDEDVHESTAYALRGLQVLGRELRLLHARSSAQALELLRQQPEVAVVLLDVVMETEQAGLATVQAIRGELGLAHVRIILRTGQPGQAPEIETIRRYDINDYKTKSELTRTRLYATLTTAIRAYDQLRRLERSRRGLEQIVAASNQLSAVSGLDAFAEGVITQLASFMGIEPEGLVCAAVEQARHQVIAAAGRYARYMHRPLSEIDDADIVQDLGRCLHERRNVVGQRGMALLLSARQGQDFAVYVDMPQPPSAQDLELLGVFCHSLALCGDNLHLLQRLRRQAYTDPLLGLPNRTAFVQRVDEVMKSGPQPGLTLALLDIDQFAEINDMLGHAYGDRLLQAIAERLQALDLRGGMVARTGGDTFGLFGPAQVVNPVALRQLFAPPVVIDGVQRPVSLSMGFVKCDAATHQGEDLMRDAAIALKRAKEQGLNRSEYYSEDLRLIVRERTRLLHGLHRAFDHDRLFVAYQPQIHLASGRATGIEALLRWRTEDGDYIAPDQFIPVAEKSGLIVAIGSWVLRTALRDLAQLHQRGYTDLRLGVNVSSVQLAQPSFLAVVDEALRDTGVPADRLELEITESIAVMGLERVAALLQQLAARGIGLAIDDFGTGFSSLSYLDRLPVQRLKIDRAFVAALAQGGAGARIAEMIVPLGHTLGMHVVAEGVETETQAQALQVLGCDEAQGYLYGRPMVIGQLAGWLAQQERKPT